MSKFLGMVSTAFHGAIWGVLLELIFGGLEATLRGDYLLHPPHQNAPTSTPHTHSPWLLHTKRKASPLLRALGEGMAFLSFIFLFNFFPFSGPHLSFWITHFCLRSPREKRGRGDTQEKGGEGSSFVNFKTKTPGKKKPTLKQRH